MDRSEMFASKRSRTTSKAKTKSKFVKRGENVDTHLFGDNNVGVHISL
jgi:hypothetical protein